MERYGRLQRPKKAEARRRSGQQIGDPHAQFIRDDFLGSSTVETGLDPRSAALAGHSAYNAALPFSSIAELHKVALYVGEHSAPKRAVIGLDFAAFAGVRGTGGD